MSFPIIFIYLTNKDICSCVHETPLDEKYSSIHLPLTLGEMLKTSACRRNPIYLLRLVMIAHSSFKNTHSH